MKLEELEDDQVESWLRSNGVHLHYYNPDRILARAEDGDYEVFGKEEIIQKDKNGKKFISYQDKKYYLIGLTLSCFDDRKEK
ncbi:MAG: hypothetical protein DDT23_00980 [candidate division WS2 bacterium]|nr:hypothetical protein [Candidatus Lithacetigena glycinireducens]